MVKHDHNRSLAGELGRLAVWAAAIYLCAWFVGWLMRRRSTAWIGMAVLFFIPVTLGIAMVINSFIFAVESNPWTDLCSDGLFRAEVTIGLVASALVGIWITSFSPSVEKLDAPPKPVAGPIVRPKFLLWLGISLAIIFGLCGLFVAWAQKSLPP